MFYQYKSKNNLNEEIIVELMKIECDLKDKNDLMNLWVKNGNIKNPLKNYWYIDSYVIKDQKECRMKYNPFCYVYEEYYKGKCISSKLLIDFDWVLEATEENKKKILDEIERNFLNPKNYKRKVIRKY